MILIEVLPISGANQVGRLFWTTVHSAGLTSMQKMTLWCWLRFWISPWWWCGFNNDDIDDDYDDSDDDDSDDDGDGDDEDNDWKVWLLRAEVYPSTPSLKHATGDLNHNNGDLRQLSVLPNIHRLEDLFWIR